jgi:hypothetical protein
VQIMMDKDHPIEWKEVADLKPLRVGGAIDYDYGQAFQQAERDGTLKVKRLSNEEQGLRMLLAGLLLLLPLVNHLSGGTLQETAAGLVGFLLILLLSRLWLGLAQRKRRHAWLPTVSAGFDITMFTLVLALLSLETPVATLNSAVVWCCYPLAIFATALRHDLRVTLFAGLMALVQSALLWLAVVQMTSEPLVSAAYGTVSTSSQLQRLVLLVAVTLLTAVVVFRAQRLTQLSGTDGTARFQTGGGNRIPLGENTLVPAKDGSPLTTTSDLDLQWYTQRVLTQTRRQYRAESGVAIVMEAARLIGRLERKCSAVAASR